MRVLRFATVPLLIAATVLGPAIPALALALIPLPTTPRAAQAGVAAHAGMAVPAPMPARAAQHVRSYGPALTVVVRAAHQVYTPGSANRYTVVVRNRGSSEVRHVWVLLAFPVSARFVSARANGTGTGDGVLWFTDIKPRRQASLVATAIAGRPGPNLRLVAATACVLRTPASTQVCGSALIRVASYHRSHLWHVAHLRRAGQSRVLRR